MTTVSEFDTEFDIEEIVREVVRRLSRLDDHAPQRNLETTTDDLPTSQRRLEGNLITLSQLDVGLKGIQTVIIGKRAVVTPSARDLLRSRDIRLVRQTDLPLPATTSKRLFIADSESWPATASLVELGRDLHYVGEKLQTGELRTGVSLLSERLQSAEARGVLITKQPAAAVCLANRRPEIRAAWGIDVPSAKAAVATIAANVLVLDCSRSSFMESRNILRTFLTTPSGFSPSVEAAL